MIQTILGIDFGLRRIGLATGNTLTKTATPLEIYQVKDAMAQTQEILAHLQKIQQDWSVNVMVIGIPRHPDGNDHEMTLHCFEFSKTLQLSFDIPIIGVDERYSSAVLPPKTKKTSGKLRAAAIDDLSAAILVEQYIQQCGL